MAVYRPKSGGESTGRLNKKTVVDNSTARTSGRANIPKRSKAPGRSKPFTRGSTNIPASRILDIPTGDDMPRDPDAVSPDLGEEVIDTVFDPKEAPSYEGLTVPNFPNVTTDAFSYIPKKFGRPEDYVEMHIYDAADNLIESVENFQEFEKGENDGQLGDDTSNVLNINPVTSLRIRGYVYGQYRVVFNIQRKKIINTFDKLFSIKSISANRREITAVCDSLDNTSLERYIRAYTNELSATPFFKDFIINFGDDITLSCINLALLKDNVRQNEIIIKTYNTIPGNIQSQDTFRIAEDIIDKLSIPVDLGFPETQKYGINLQGPNFKIDTRINTSVPSQFKNYDELLSFKSISGSYQRVLNELSNKDLLSIQYDYIRPTSGSDIGEPEEITYHFENFVHFSSAVERLKNFEYKIKLIELYDKQLGEIGTITGPTSGSIVVVNQQNSIKEKKDKLIESFDGYEKFLYFDSGSKFSWPKNSSVLENGFYSLYPVTSSQAKNWLGNDNSDFPSYGGQLQSASLFDQQNPNNLEKLIPNFIQDDVDDRGYKLFYNMMGQHFDQIFLYIKHITEQKNTHHIRGMSKDLVYHSLKSIGLETFDQFENANLIEYILGQSATGSEFMNTTFAGETLVTASNAGSMPKKDISREVWKRLYHNAPYLLKTKGTERGIRALMSCYGVPSTILNIKEYGGPVADKTGYKTFSYDKTSLALEGGQSNILQGNQGITVAWSSSLTDALSSSAKTVTFRAQPNYPTGHEGLSHQGKYHLFTLSGQGFSFNGNGIGAKYSSSVPHLFLEPNTSGDISASGDAKLFGRLGVSVSESITYTKFFPIYNGDFWNIFIGHDGVSGSSSTVSFGAYQSNFNKNVSHYTASYTQTEEFRTRIWGDPYSGSGTYMGGAHSAYFFGLPGTSETGGTGVDKRTFGDAHSNAYRLAPFSGSFQEIRYYFHKSGSYEILSHDTLTKQALTPFIYAGNSISSSFDEVVFRLPLGSNNIKPNVEGINFPGNHKKYQDSFHPNQDIKYITNISSSRFLVKIREIDEVHHLPTPDTVGASMTSEKVRLDEGTIDNDILSPLVKSETSVLDRQPLDYEDLGVFLSPTNEINEDIIYTLGAFRLDDYIGSPLPSVQTASVYEDLKDIKDIYFKKVKRRYNYWDYIKLIQYIDHTLFKLVEQFVPAKANLKTGLLIEPHYLERNKFARELPVINQGQSMTSGSFNTLDFRLDPERSLKLQSSSVVTTNNTSFITGSNGKRIEQGTNTTLDVSTSDKNSVILNEVPNTTFNTQFCQAPIQPFTTEKPEGYKQYSSNVILGNAKKATTSNIYYNRRRVITSNTQDY